MASVRRRVGREEVVFLAGALVVVLAGWGFVEVASEVIEGDTRAFDEWLLRQLRQPNDPPTPRGPGWLVEAARDTTAMGSTTVLVFVVLAVLGYLRLEEKFRAMSLVVVATAGGLVISTVLKEAFGRARPDVVPALVPVDTPSFPSGHSMLAAVVYLTLGALLSRVLGSTRAKVYVIALAMFLALLVGISRIYLGAHYPSDVLAGWAAGLGWALGCSLLARYLQRRGMMES
jgi:undecaprenyl-diphosphatase